MKAELQVYAQPDRSRAFADWREHWLNSSYFVETRVELIDSTSLEFVDLNETFIIFF